MDNILNQLEMWKLKNIIKTPQRRATQTWINMEVLLMILSCSFLMGNKLASDMCLQAPVAVCCMSYSANMAVFWKMFLEKCVWEKNAGGNCCWIYTTWKNLWKKKTPIILGISGYPPNATPPRNDALLYKSLIMALLGPLDSHDWKSPWTIARAAAEISPRTSLHNDAKNSDGS